MSNTSNKHFKTLNHLYNAPVLQRCSRDFVRENKENVRSKQGKHPIGSYVPFTSSADKISSRSSGFPQTMTEQQRNIRTSSPNKNKMRCPTKKQPWTYGREASDRKNLQQNVCTRAKTNAPQSPRRQNLNAKAKMNGLNAKTATSSIAIQTDEINDEIYLYNALKKCASPAFKSALKSKYLQKERDTHSKQSANVSQEINLNLDDSQDLRLQHDQSTQLELKRENAGYDKPIQRAEAVQTDLIRPDSQRSASVYQTARDLYEELPVSNLNVMTMETDSINRCSPTKCTNCPVGYHLLSAEERETLRAKLLNHESLLIKQLNSFPLAIETLRVRQSKTRIEKELSILEQNLRKLTKRKVYAKIHE